MAEITAFRNNALPYPVYGVGWTLVLPILDADGDPVTSGTIDGLVSKNGDTAAATTNTPTQIPSSSGLFYLTLTATEMTADIVCGSIGSTATGAKRTLFTLYPRKLVTLASGSSAGGDTGYITLAASTVTYDGQYAGCLCVAVNDTVPEARILQTSSASNQQCTVTPAWNTAPDNVDDTYTIYLPEGRQVAPVNVTHVAGTAQTAGDTNALITARLPNATPGAAGGVFIAGTNAPVTITGAGAALSLVSTSGNGSGLVATGQGTGQGVLATGGASGAGIKAVGGATANGYGIRAEANSNNCYGIHAVGNAGTESGGIKGSAIVSGEGIEGEGAGNGHGLLVKGAGTGEGLHATGGTGNTGDGAHFEAGSGATNGCGLRLTGIGVGQSHGLYAARGSSAGDDIHAANSDTPTLIPGSVSGSVGSVSGAVGSVTGDVGGKVLGGGAGVITGAGAWALTGTGDASATEASASAAAADAADVAGYLESMTVDGAGAVFTALALANAPTGGGTPLTAQQTRDAMLLDPTGWGGDVGEGGVDDQIIALPTAVNDKLSKAHNYGPWGK